MLPPNIIPPDSHKRRKKTSNREHDLEWTQMTSKDLSQPQSNPLHILKQLNFFKKNKLKVGGKTEINDNYLDEILQNKKLWMELVMQVFSNDILLRSDTAQDLLKNSTQNL